MPTAICLSSAGLLLDIVGAILIAYEIWAPFRGTKYRDDITFDESNEPVRETNEFASWNKRKYKLMVIGLGLLSIGFGLQLAANFVKS